MSCIVHIDSIDRVHTYFFKSDHYTIYVYGFNVEFMYYFCGNFYTLSFLGKIFEKIYIYFYSTWTH